MIKYLFVISLLINAYFTTKKDPVSIANLFEGDIAYLTSGDINVLHGNAKNKKTFFRNGVLYQRKLWPKNKIPYVYTGGIKRNMLDTISKAMETFQNKTCIRYEISISNEI